MQYYQQLTKLIARLTVALPEGDVEIAPLLREYATVIAALQQAAPGDVAPDLAFLLSLRQEVADLVVAAEQQQDVLRRQLTQMGKQKQQIVAYTKAQML